MKDEILQKAYPPLKLAEVGKSYQHENVKNKENNVKDNDEWLPLAEKTINFLQISKSILHI